MNSSPLQPPKTDSPRPLLLFGLLTAIGWMACVLWPRLLVSLGIASYGMWYLDSYAVLAAVDAVRLGLHQGPGVANSLDPLFRDHKYSDWWFALRWLGLTRESNFLIGSAWVGAFAAAVGWSARPRNFREAVWLAILMLSPPVLLGVHRANNDLVIFVLLAVVGMAAAGLTWWRQIFAVAVLALATGLKFYPVTAALAFLWIQPPRRRLLALLLAGVVAGLTIASVWSQLARAQFSLPSTLHTVGAAQLWRDLNWTNPATVWLGPVLITLAAAGLVWGRFTVGLATQGERSERLLAALGAIVLLACFAAGISYAYRWIFALWMALWLWRRSASPVGLTRQTVTVRFGCALLGLCFWFDGALCLVVNVLLPPMSPERLEEIQRPWRLCTQPLVWLMMMMLAGWLLEAAIVAAKEWAASRQPDASAKH